MVRLGRRLIRAAAILAAPGLTAAAVVTFPATAEAVSPARSTRVAEHTVAPSRLPRGAADLGSLDLSTVLDVSVTLEPRDPDALDSFLADVTTPGSASYRHYLAPGEFGGRFGADPATVAQVTDRLRAAGVRPGPPDSNMLSIPVEGTAAE